ncbi:NmrA/HSCARG family protein [Streptomyces sp. NPDC056660]|uniref:NmrA/HSCARG family protein n=1 Tax=Streptomyces sp. NPDC056660 TaxID=3345897 RepID=UPI003674695B
MTGPAVGVVGATGQQGGAVVRHLLAAGTAVRALVLDPASARARQLAALGVTLVPADLGDEAAVTAAFTGLDAVFAMTTFVTEGPAGEVRHGRAIADAAEAAGVARVVYSSVGGAERATGIPHFESKWQVEEYLRSKDLSVTVIRPVFFMDNFTNRSPITDDQREQVFRYPLKPGVPLQMIAVEDIGAVCATALLDPAAIADGHLEIAGDELTPEQIARVFQEWSGVATRFEAEDVSGIADDDQRAMYAWFTQPPSYIADFDATRRLRPSVLTLPGFLARRR